MTAPESGRLKMMKLSAIAIFGAMALVMVFIIGLS